MIVGAVLAMQWKVIIQSWNCHCYSGGVQCEFATLISILCFQLVSSGSTMTSVQKHSVWKNSEKQDIQFEISIQWMQSEIDDWLHTLFPLIFQWLDTRWGKPESGRFHWALLQKSYSHLIVLDWPAMRGKDLFLVHGSAGKGFMLHTIYIGCYKRK